MCDSISCNKNHIIITKIDKFDLIVSYREMVRILVCLVDERVVCCDRCKNCNECRKLLYFINTLEKIDGEVRRKPQTYIKMVKFNKIRSKLELYNAKTYKSFEEAKKDRVQFFSFKVMRKNAHKLLK